MSWVKEKTRGAEGGGLSEGEAGKNKGAAEKIGKNPAGSRKNPTGKRKKSSGKLEKSNGKTGRRKNWHSYCNIVEHNAGADKHAASEHGDPARTAALPGTAERGLALVKTD